MHIGTGGEDIVQNNKLINWVIILVDNFAILYIDCRFDKIRELIEKSVLLRQPLHSQSRTGDCRKGKKLLQLNSCNSNSCNLKNHLNRKNSLVLSEFTSKPLQENSFNSNSHNSKNHLNRTNFSVLWTYFSSCNPNFGFGV